MMQIILLGYGLETKKKAFWIRFGAIAACFAILIGTLLAVPFLRKNEDTDDLDLSDIDLDDIITEIVRQCIDKNIINSTCR